MPTSRNPRAGLPARPGEEYGKWGADACSGLTGEQLAGTAKNGNIILALEYQRGWGRDILDGEALGPELSGKLKRFLKANDAQLQFIRKSGREGQKKERKQRPTLYISWARGDSDTAEPILEYMHVDGPASLLNLDLSTPGRTPGAQRVDHPLLLVCTHGKRDRCCAVQGRPLATALSQEFPEQIVWESSHTKGHRFAPAMLLLPGNYSYGHMGDNGAAEVIEHAMRGEAWLQGNRGRGIWDAPGQVAELTVARSLTAEDVTIELNGLKVEEQSSDELAIINGEGAAKHNQAVQVNGEDAGNRGEAVQVNGQGTGNRGKVEMLKHGGAEGSSQPRTVRRVTAPSLGREWIVTLEKRDSVLVVTSCGDAPKKSSSWVAVGVEEATLEGGQSLSKRGDV